MDDEDFIGAFIGCASDDSEGESEQDVAKVIVKPNDEVACDKDKKLQEHFKEAAAQKHPQKAPRKPSVEKPELFHIPKEYVLKAKSDFFEACCRAVERENKMLMQHYNKQVRDLSYKTEEEAETKRSNVPSLFVKEQKADETPAIERVKHTQADYIEKRTRIRIVDKCVSESFLDERIQQHKYISLLDIDRHIKGGIITGEWCTIGVVCKVELKQGKKAPFLFVRLSLLDKFTRLMFIFSPAMEQFRSLKEGTVLILWSPKIAPGSEKDTSAALSIDNADRICEIGKAMDAARCKGFTKGRSCENIVDGSGIGYCDFHLFEVQKKIKGSRPYMGFSAQPVGKPANTNTKTAGLYYAGPENVVANPKSNQNDQLKPQNGIKSRYEQKITENYLKTGTHGARLGILAEGGQDIHQKDGLKRIVSQKKSPTKFNSKKDFREAFAVDPVEVSKEKQANFSDSDGEPDMNEVKKSFKAPDPNKFESKKPTQEQIERLKSNAKELTDKPAFRESIDEILNPRKRSSNEEQEGAEKKRRMAQLAAKFNMDPNSAEFHKLANSKSSLAEEFNHEEHRKMTDYLKLEEFKEQVSEKIANITITHCTAHYCTNCNFYSSAPVATCIENGHVVTKKTNVPRNSFICSTCKKKILHLGPTLPKRCQKCNGTQILPAKYQNIEYVPETMKVLPRGVEHGKFFNS